MRRNFYDLLKYAKTGIASPDMTAYDKMRALAMAGSAKYPVQTITGVPPISFRSDGSPLDNVTIIGNSQQNGTPTPDAPVSVDGCGDWDAGANSYVIPITSAGQTQNVYLGQVQTTRRIKKLVLDGTERWSELGTSGKSFYIGASDILVGVEAISTHYESEPFNVIYVGSFVGVGVASTQKWLAFSTGTVQTTDAWKTYLASQYTAGTPVTVWYVLAEPETEIVNEPLAKIGDYADELHSADAGITIPTVRGSNTLTIDTDLQPSEITITGHIKQA